MKISDILYLARRGRPDLAAANIGSNGFSMRAVTVIARYAHESGDRFSCKDLYKYAYSHRRKD